jgi:hypothetical protein
MPQDHGRAGRARPHDDVVHQRAHQRQAPATSRVGRGFPPRAAVHHRHHDHVGVGLAGQLDHPGSVAVAVFDGVGRGLVHGEDHRLGVANRVPAHREPVAEPLTEDPKLLRDARDRHRERGRDPGAQAQDRGVVAAILLGEQCLDQRPGHRGELLVDRPREGGSQPLDPNVERLLAPFHQPVGV